MCIKQQGWFCLCLTTALLFGLYGYQHLGATTIEVENQDEDITVASTPLPTGSVPTTISKQDATPKLSAPQMSPAREETGPSMTASSNSSSRRVRVNEHVNFHYFMKAGYAVLRESETHSIGNVISTLNDDLNYTTPKRIYLEMTSNTNGVKAGDFFVIYRSSQPIQESQSGFSGFLVENLAVVQVLEVQKQKCQAEIKQSFKPFRSGEKVKPYEDEVKRWKQAQIKKALPDHPLRCFVATGEAGQSIQITDFIILTAGSKKGVVEGQKFELRQHNETDTGEILRTPSGHAQVIFAGPDSSTAQIISNNVTIQKGFEAVYRP
jgi:hypothetical protein